MQQLEDHVQAYLKKGERCLTDSDSDFSTRRSCRTRGHRLLVAPENPCDNRGTRFVFAATPGNSLGVANAKSIANAKTPSDNQIHHADD
jgi:hypothetical protein